MPLAPPPAPQVLSQFLERHEEVPVVAMYRKELAGPLLAMADDDTPRTSTVVGAPCVLDVR